MMRFLKALACGAAATVGMAACGCTATPGFVVKWELMQPPTIKQAAPVSPVEAPPIGYAIENVQAWPRYSRAPFSGYRSGQTFGFVDPCQPPAVNPPLGQADPGRSMPKGPAGHDGM